MLSLTSLSPHIHKLKYLVNENSTTLLTGAGVVGTVGTAVLTGRASFKAAKLIEKAEVELDPQAHWPKAQKARARLMERYPEGEDAPKEVREELERISQVQLSKTEKVKLVWVHYIPPVAMGAATITSIVLAHRISSKKIAAIAIASTISERALQEYKDKVVEKLGVRKETEIRDEIAQDAVTKNLPSNQVIIAGSGDVLCFEPLTGRYFNSTIETIKKAENKVNYEIIHFDSCSLSYFFEEVGLAPTDYSDMVGWNVANRMEVNFSTTMSEDNRPCLVIGFVRMPSLEYDKVWT